MTMNIFVLDRDPLVAARDHCNKHVVKMILESAQMLCAAHWFHLLKMNNKQIKDFKRVRDAQNWLYENTPKKMQPPWKLSHTRHPCTLWTSETISNYYWHLNLGEALTKQYTERYGKHHKSEAVLEWLRENIPVGILDEPLTEFPQCMPEECKVPGDAPAAYKNYYIKYKRHMAKWEPRSKTPKWFDEGIINE